MNGSFIGGTISEETQADAVRTLHPGPQGRARGNGDTRSQDASFSHAANAEVGEVHRAALAPVDPGPLAKQFGHQPF